VGFTAQGFILLIAGVISFVLLWFFGPDDADEFGYYGMVPYLLIVGGACAIIVSP